MVEGSNITITCPPDMQLTADPNTGLAYVEYPDATATTTCASGGLSVAHEGGIPSGGEYSPGNYQVTFIAVDDCGTFATCNFYVEILDGNTGGCPDNLPGHSYLGEYNGSAYFLSDDVARPEDAEVIAQGFGGHLVTIGSQSENDFLKPFVSGIVYIGLNDATTEGTLEWFSGEPVIYTNFDICGFCNGNSADQDYAVIHGWNGGWSWSNFWNQRQYIIELPCSSPINSGSPQSSIAFNNNALTNEEAKKPTLESLIPNPASEYIFVKINSQLEETVDVQIFDARGTLVKTVAVELYKGLVFKELDITELPSGLFFVKIINGQKKHSQMKFVKQRK